MARTRILPYVLAFCLSTQAMAAQATGTLIATEQVAASTGAVVATPDAGAARDTLLAALDRADVAAALTERGVSVDAARERVAALTDAEAIHLAQQIDSAPAGADSLLGIIVFIFVLLLITDILGLTKVFPFTRSVR